MRHYQDTNGNFFGTEGSIPTNYTEVTIAEINLANEEKAKAAYNALSYAEKRQAAYAPLSEQLDMQYWDAMNNTETWLDHIRSVKEAHPKEGE